MSIDENLLLEDKENVVIKETGYAFIHVIIINIIFICVGIFKLQNEKTLFNIKEHWLISIPIFIIILGLYNILFPKVLMIITPKGIWIKEKGLITWNDIHYFYIAQYLSKSDTHSFCLRTIGETEEIEIQLENSIFSNPKHIKITSTINKFYQDSDKIDLGIKDMNRDI